MSILISVIILITVALIQACMQLTPGVFSIFYHYTLGKKSRNFADNLSLYFILGNEIFVITIYFILCIIIFTFNNYIDINNPYIYWILAGIFVAESIISLFLYYKKGKTTELFISRNAAKSLILQAERVKRRSDAFLLGFLSCLPEVLFTLPLYLISILLLINFNLCPRSIIIILIIFSSLLATTTTFIFYHTGHNLADVSRLRLKMKPFIRIILFLCFLTLAITTIIGVK